MFSTLEEIVRHYIPISLRPNAQGWYSVLCKVCHDHGRKGKRAGFKFDASTVGYNCFNCGHAAMYDASQYDSMPEDMRTVLDAFGVPRDDWQRVVFLALANRGQLQKRTVSNADIEPHETTFPPYFYRLGNDPNDEWALCANDHLREKRKMTCADYPFYLAAKSDSPDNKKWYGRLIIPVYKHNKLIFWQGRDLSEHRSRKYLSPDVPRENVLYGYEHLFEDTQNPLYVVEGFFDAFAVKGVAVFGGKITPNQLRWINQSRRPKVVVPDKFGNGIHLAEQALELGWSVSTPDIGSCKDISDAVVKYGLLYTLRSIKEHTSNGFEAATRIRLYCK